MKTSSKHVAIACNIDPLQYRQVNDPFIHVYGNR